MHWIKDYQRCSDEPDITKLNIEAIETAIDRSNLQKSNKDSVEVKALVLDKFVNDKDWDTLSKAMKAYLGAMIGIEGIPIVYVIRDEKPEPDDTIYESFVDHAIVRAPMSGTTFTNDTRTVHFIMASLTTGGPGEQWIHPLARFHNGRKYWLALYAHYTG